MGRYPGGIIKTTEATTTSGVFTTDEVYQSVNAGVPAGQTDLSGAGVSTWTCPKGVTEISFCGIGGGGGSSIVYANWPGTINAGGGGYLTYKNTISVTPHRTYFISTGAAGYGQQPLSNTSNYVNSAYPSPEGGHTAWAQGTVALACGGGGSTGLNEGGSLHQIAITNYDSNKQYRGYGGGGNFAVYNDPNQENYSWTNAAKYKHRTTLPLRIGDGGGDGAPAVRSGYNTVNAGGGGAGGYVDGAYGSVTTLYSEAIGGGGVGGSISSPAPGTSLQTLGSGASQVPMPNSGASTGGNGNNSSYSSASQGGYGGSTKTGGRGTTPTMPGGAGTNGTGGSADSDGIAGGGGAGSGSRSQGLATFNWRSYGGVTGIAGCARIIWSGSSGTTRAYPATNTGDV